MRIEIHLWYFWAYDGNTSPHAITRAVQLQARRLHVGMEVKLSHPRSVMMLVAEEATRC